MEKYGFVYITVNLVNGKKYIGQRKYVDGWEEYLGSGKLLIRAIHKYGKENFQKTILQDAYSKEELDELEKYYIKLYDACNSDEFYNLASGGTGGNVLEGYDEEVKERIKAKQRAAVSSASKLRCGESAPSHILSEEDVIQIVDRMLHQIENSETVTDIANDFNVSVNTVYDVRHHRTWAHLTEGVAFPEIPSSLKHSHPPRKPIVAFTVDGEFVGEYASARDAARELGVGYRMISRVVNGVRPYTHGYVFKYA